MQATLIESRSNHSGEARLYRVEPPMRYAKEYDADWNPVYADTEYVVVSAVTSEYTGSETYIFPANQEGTVIDCDELHGSYCGGLDHAEALRRAGYIVNAGQNDASGGAE